MNAVMLSGTVVREPNVRATQKGTAVASFTVLTTRRFGKNMEFEGKDYISCIAWGNEAQKVGGFVKAGTKVEVKGRIGTRSYEKDGQKVWVTEVNAESVDIPGMQTAQPQQTDGFSQTAPAGFGQFGQVNYDENIPF